MPVVNMPERDPVCPHCEVTLSQVAARPLGLPWGAAFLVYCPSCFKTLGVTHRKGNMMG